MAFAERVQSLDVSLFDYIESQTTANDRRTLLALQEVVAKRRGTYTYLEIGSYLGGSLQAVIADPRCRRIVSIDSRPATAPDNRGVESVYFDNNVQRMLNLLAAVPGAELNKVTTVDGSTESLDPAAFPSVDLVFIDGEHTTSAALRDARFCRNTAAGECVFAFHDFTVVGDAALDFLQETRHNTEGFLLRDDIFVVHTGTSRSLLSDPLIRSQLRGPAKAWKIANLTGAVRLLVSPRHLYQPRRAPDATDARAAPTPEDPR